MTRKGTVAVAATLAVASLALVADASGAGAHKPKPKPLQFTLAYSGKAEYSSQRQLDCLNEDEFDKGKWLVTYDFGVPAQGEADLVGAEGSIFPKPSVAGYIVNGSGCGEPLSCNGTLDANPLPDDDLTPILAGKPKGKSVIDFTVDAPSDWRATDVTGGRACPDDGERGFFPAYTQDQLPSMLQAEFKVPVGDLRELPVGGKMIVPIKSRKDQLPPLNCSQGLATCTQELEPWKGKVVMHRNK